MEEMQIKDIVHRASTNEAFREELVNDTQAVIEREKLSPRVAQVIAQLVPHLNFSNPDQPPPSWTWWNWP